MKQPIRFWKQPRKWVWHYFKNKNYWRYLCDIGVSL